MGRKEDAIKINPQYAEEYTKRGTYYFLISQVLNWVS